MFCTVLLFIAIDYRVMSVLALIPQCILADANYGPLAENIKQYPLIGEQFIKFYCPYNNECIATVSFTTK